MPDTTGVVVTIREIHQQVSETRDEISEVNGRIKLIESNVLDIPNIRDRLAKVERSISSHSVIIGIVTAGIGALLGKVLFV